jgi:hypothetical protein
MTGKQGYLHLFFKAWEKLLIIIMAMVLQTTNAMLKPCEANQKQQLQVIIKT